MYRGRVVGWNGLGGYGGLGRPVNTRLFGHSQLGRYGGYGGYAGTGEVGVSTLLLAALFI